MLSIEKALNLIERGDVQEGIRELKRLESSSDDEQKFLIAQLYHELGHMDSAKKIVKQLLQTYKNHGELLILLAEILIDENNEDEALLQLMAIEEDDDIYVQAQILLADLYQMQSLDEVAEQKLLLAAKKAPNEPVVSLGLGLFYLDRGDYLKSIPYLKKAVHANAQYIEDEKLELYLAEAYSASGQFEDALHYYEQGTKKYADPDTLFGYGFTAFQLGEISIAIAELERLREMDRDYSSVYPLLAKAYEAEERLDDALETILDGISVDEFNESLYVHAGKLSLKKQNQDEAEQYLREAIAINPGNMDACTTLLALLKHDDRFDEILDIVEHLKEYGEEDYMLSWYAASALTELEQYEQARLIYEEITPNLQNNVEFLEEYGYFLLELGKRQEAISMFRTALQIDRERTDLAELLDNLEED